MKSFYTGEWIVVEVMAPHLDDAEYQIIREPHGKRYASDDPRYADAEWTGPIPRPFEMNQADDGSDRPATDTAFASAPWRATELVDPIEGAEWGDAAVWDACGDLVCATSAQLNGDGSMETGVDRARLIAAAPDLLAAAERVLDAVQSSDPAEPEAQRPDQGAVQELQDALDAARGG